MGYLPQRVNARVGSPTADDTDFVVGDFCQGFFKNTLHGRFLALYLPAQELPTVVFDSDRVSQGLYEVQHLLGFRLLFLATVGRHFFEDLACCLFVSHGDVSTRQVELDLGI